MSLALVQVFVYFKSFFPSSSLESLPTGVGETGKEVSDAWSPRVALGL